MVRVYIEVQFENSKNIKSFQSSAKSTFEAYDMCVKKLEECNKGNEKFNILYVLKSYSQYFYEGQKK